MQKKQAFETMPGHGKKSGRARVLRGHLILFILLLGFGPALDGGTEENKVNLKWSGHMSLGVAMTKGNSETLNVSFSFDINKNFEDKLEWRNTGFYLYNSKQETKSAESMGLTSRLNWLKSKGFYSYVEFQVLRDIFKDYNYRLTPGLGFGYGFIESKKVKYSMYVGLNQVITRYISSEMHESHAGVKLGDQLTWKLSSTTELKQKAELVYTLSASKKYFFRFETGIAAAITKRSALSFSFVNSFDSAPSKTGIKKNDYRLMSGINFKF